MHDLAEALFQIVLEVLAIVFGEKARNRECAWAVLWFMALAAIAWIILAAIGS